MTYMKKWSKYDMDKDIKRSKEEDHIYGIINYFSNFLNHNITEKDVQNISDKCEKNRDFIVQKEQSIIECKSDYYKLSKTGFDNENCVIEIMGSVDYNIVKKYFNEHLYIWIDGCRKSSIEPSYDILHNCIRNTLLDNKIRNKINLGYFFSIPEKNYLNLFIYYYVKYNRYLVLSGERDSYMLKRKMGLFVNKLFREKDPNCFLQIAPNEHYGKKYLTVNYLIPIYIIKDTPFFLAEFEKD